MLLFATMVLCTTSCKKEKDALKDVDNPTFEKLASYIGLEYDVIKAELNNLGF